MTDPARDARMRGQGISPASQGLILEPDWIVPIESPAIRGGCMVAVSGRIEHLGRQLPQRFHALPRIRLENTAILPGLVNSHCHLEFSDLDSPIPADGSFDEWLARAMAQRSALSSQSPEERLAFRRAAMQRGILESWQHGVRWIVDNVTSPWNRLWIAEAQAEIRRRIPSIAATELIPDAALWVEPLFELVDVRAQRWQETWNFAFEQVTAPKSPGIRRAGLAPHAPYTASLRVSHRAAEWSEAHQALVSMHLAESAEELQWVDLRRGPLGEWIAPKLDQEHSASIGTIDEHLSNLLQCWRALVVHGNYLENRQIERIAEHAQRMAVVLCPRTHAWFRHPEHPIGSLAARGATVLLGTDSRASNPDLNLWLDVRHAAGSETPWTIEQWARRATADASRFLELPDGIGRIRPGSATLLTAMQWEPSDGASRGLLHSEQALWDWIADRGKPYPLETDSRLVRSRPIPTSQEDEDSWIR